MADQARKSPLPQKPVQTSSCRIQLVFQITVPAAIYDAVNKLPPGEKLKAHQTLLEQFLSKRS